MTVGQLHIDFITQLTPLYPKEEAQALFEVLAAHFLKLNRAQLVLSKSETLSLKAETSLKDALVRLKEQEPIQYIIGETEFYGLLLKVTPATLIPRPETEELVHWIVQDYRGESPLGILDLCTGSGCIAIALATTLKQAKVAAVDISEPAIQVAKQNALSHGAVVRFTLGDVLKENNDTQEFDVIVSNPPYVRNSERAQMAANVLEHEPSEALFVTNEDPLIFYRAIGRYAQNHLNKGGALYLEINEYLSKEMHLLLSELGFGHIEIKTDMYGKKRMIKCW